MDLFNDPEFINEILKKRDRPSNLNNSMERVLQATELPKEPQELNLGNENPSIFWKGLPVAANLADALTVMQTRANATRADGSKIKTEANPLMRGIVDKPEILLPLKLLTGLGISKVADWAGKKKGNKTAAKLISGLASAPALFGTYTNLKRTSQLKRNKQR